MSKAQEFRLNELSRLTEQDTQMIHKLDHLIASIDPTGHINQNHEDTFLLALRIFRHVVSRGSIKKLDYFNWLSTMKFAVREAEVWFTDLLTNNPGRFIGWYSGCSPMNNEQGLANLICYMIFETTKAIVDNESQYPELKAVFDGERASYRQMLEDATEAA